MKHISIHNIFQQMKLTVFVNVIKTTNFFIVEKSIELNSHNVSTFFIDRKFTRLLIIKIFFDFVFISLIET